MLDFADAFYMLPLVDCEKRYYVAYYDGFFYCWDRIAQGSLNGPTAFGRLSALTSRMTQALYPDGELQLQVYTDDPCAAIRGTPRRVKLIATVLALFWRALGWQLSYHKGQLGKTVDWIGFTFKITADGISVEIKADFMSEFRKSVVELLRLPKVSLGEVQSFAGRANHIPNTFDRLAALHRRAVGRHLLAFRSAQWQGMDQTDQTNIAVA